MAGDVAADDLLFCRLQFHLAHHKPAVAQYLVAVSNFMLATLAALVPGKAVLVANKMSLLRRYDRAPLIQPILYKTALLLSRRLPGPVARAFRALALDGNPPGDFPSYTHLS
jgi:hypothetical protein